MSNPLKGVSKVFKSVTKVVTKNKNLIMLGAAIYFGGAMAGAWGAPAAETVGAAGATAGAGSGGMISGAMGAEAAGTAAATNYGSVAAQNAVVSGASQAAGASVMSGIKGATSAVLGYLEKNPAATLIAGNMLASAFTPTAAEEQMQLDKYRRQNSNIAGVQGNGSGQPISLKPGGMISNVIQPRTY